MNDGNDYRDSEWYEYKGRKVYLVDTLFGGMVNNALAVDSSAKELQKDGEATIGVQDVYILKDGMHVELCHWWMEGMSFWDLSIDKAEFERKSRVDFLTYLYNMGVYLDSVLDRFACQWRYCGVQPNETVWRIQYYLENEDDD